MIRKQVDKKNNIVPFPQKNNHPEDLEQSTIDKLNRIFPLPKEKIAELVNKFK